MSSLSRFFGSRDDVPAWASFLDAARFGEFLACLDAEIRERGMTWEPGEGVAHLRTADGRSVEMGLVNLAQVCGQLDRSKWTQEMRHWLEATAGTEVNPREFSAARRFLKQKLYPHDYGRGGPPMLARPFAEGIQSVLVLDLPGSVASLAPDNAASWGVAADELFRIGLENVKAEGRIEPKRFDLPDGGQVMALIGDSFFTSSRALLIEEVVAADAPLGALVAVPHRHTLLVHEIRDGAVIGAISTMIPMAFGMFQEGPGSISPNLFWWRGGSFVHLPAKVTPTQVDFSPPDEFVEVVLNALG